MTMVLTMAETWGFRKAGANAVRELEADCAIPQSLVPIR
jgi:hypothetical protein